MIDESRLTITSHPPCSRPLQGGVRGGSVFLGKIPLPFAPIHLQPGLDVLSKATLTILLTVILNALVACDLPLPSSLPVALNASTQTNLRVGVAARAITPNFPVYIAGGIPYRLALGVHDDIWARSIVIESDGARIALVSLDLIGINYDDVVAIRTQLTETLAMDYVLIAATHSHNAPDVLGLWAPDPFCSDTLYRGIMRQVVVESIIDAAANTQPATIDYAIGNSGTPQLNRDTREPNVIDDTLAIWQARSSADNSVITTVVHYAAHPILIPSLNADISSDFPHWLRSAIEDGVDLPDIQFSGQGGTCVFFNGALGGRITPAGFGTTPRNDATAEPHRNAEAYGYTLAQRALQLLDNERETITHDIDITAASVPITVTVENPVLNFAMRSCLIDRGIDIDRITSEAARITIGPLEFFAAPGMLLPELVTGELIQPVGLDFPNATLESPTVNELSTTGSPIVIGLANDMLGYIIPRGLWDAAPPIATTNELPPYGEVVSMGPGAAEAVINGWQQAVASLDSVP